MQGIRAAISQGNFADFRDKTLAGWALGDIAAR
jgi:queuine/archaeosine tRNA-ribosyltransferase